MVISKSACAILDSVLGKKIANGWTIWSPSKRTWASIQLCKSQTLPCTLVTLVLGVGNRQTPRVCWPGASQSSGLKLCRRPAVLTSFCYCDGTPSFSKGWHGVYFIVYVTGHLWGKSRPNSSRIWRQAWLFFCSVTFDQGTHSWPREHSRNHGGTLFSGFHMGSNLTSFLIQSRTTCPGNSATHSVLGPPALISNQRNPLQNAHGPVWSVPSDQVSPG